LDPVRPLPPTILLHQAEFIIPRLEKLTPDLKAAHRASGVRRTLLRLTRETDPDDLTPQSLRLLENTLARGYRLLDEAARGKFQP
jgi:hypothetical protein